MRLPRVLLAAVGLVLIMSATAHAGNRNQPIVGDLNRDGRPDVTTLGPLGDTNVCTLNVQYRRADGTLRPPVTYTYTSPLPRQPFCPDMGVAVDLGGDGVTELVLTHFNNSRGDLLVLRKFKVTAVYQGVSFPSTIRTADFDGDGLVDIWQSTDEVETLLTLRNTPASTIVPGAINVCSRVPIPNHALADFNGDGGQDFLLSRVCRNSLAEAAVYFGTGGSVVLASTTEPWNTRYEVYASDFNNDGVPDAGLITYTGGTSTVRHFVNSGTGVFTEVPALAAAAPKISADSSQGAHH
ncbi:hypothetical protein Lesp02_48960 [Lentzea sp. NBRC 105346]|uniref:VCBS repeat-containing protein n=1 Tax=Lentzea sp. NBRC 105346 TaxID=3032205 RepID=UPI0024A5A003|nr:VCBS repeat-containing protein [Lentzea sp. NBRC 105346]GLZ32708.1 hypothetical protein Lesp02_48960 [Lentzea sp. NBRC 105346]